MRRIAFVPASLLFSFAIAGVAFAEPARNLNSVPEDGNGLATPLGPDNPFIRQVVSARPNEELVICVAGCFSGRDKVVYAQPADKPVRPASIVAPDAKPVEPAKPAKPLGPAASANPYEVPRTVVGNTAASVDPRAPSIINGGPKSN